MQYLRFLGRSWGSLGSYLGALGVPEQGLGPVCVLEPVFFVLSIFLRLGLEVVGSGI